MVRAPWFVCVLAFLIGCGGDDPVVDASSDSSIDADASVEDAGPDAGPYDNDEPFAPTLYCPGPDCERVGDDVLRVGAAKVDTTPVIDETSEYLTLDMDADGEYDPSQDTFNDANGDGVFDGQWIAGYGRGRAASAVADPQWARAIVLEQNGVTMALVSVDCIGFFGNDIELARGIVTERGLPIDYVSVSSTHSHGARDTIGIWGRDLASTGRDPAYNERVQLAIADSVEAAWNAREPAHVQYATTLLRDKEGGILRYTGDTRDPFIVDDELRVIRFGKAGDDTQTIATLLNFGSHPEVSGMDYTLLTSDYPHFFREVVENGVELPTGETYDGVGGIAVFYQGALGSQIGPLRSQPVDFDGTELPKRSRRTAEVLGQRLGIAALEALGEEGGSTLDETADLGFRSHQFYVRVDNTLFQLGFNIGLMTRDAHFYNPRRASSTTSNQPWIKTEVAVLDIGRAQVISIPGELDPSLWLGGYDGSATPPGVPLVDETRTNPAELSLAPEGPYLRELARADADYVFFFGLAQDFLGYLVPAFDYEVAATSPYLNEAEGAHYEETNSLGPDNWPRIEMKIRRLLAWSPE